MHIIIPYFYIIMDYNDTYYRTEIHKKIHVVSIIYKSIVLLLFNTILLTISISANIN